MLNLMKAAIVALVVGGVGLAGLAPAQAATFVAGGPGAHVAVHTGPAYDDGYYPHRHFYHRHRHMVCFTRWHHHHPVEVCRPTWG